MDKVITALENHSRSILRSIKDNDRILGELRGEVKNYEEANANNDAMLNELAVALELLKDKSVEA